jgi:hypothetical protein
MLQPSTCLAKAFAGIILADFQDQAFVASGHYCRFIAIPLRTIKYRLNGACWQFSFYKKPDGRTVACNERCFIISFRYMFHHILQCFAKHCYALNRIGLFIKAYHDQITFGDSIPHNLFSIISCNATDEPPCRTGRLDPLVRRPKPP